VKQLITVVVCVFFLFGAPHDSNALIYEFDTSINGNQFHATMDLNVRGNKLTISIQNLSPAVSGATISGFGVSLTNYPSIFGGLQWNLVEGGNNDITGQWLKVTGGYSTNQVFFIANNPIFGGLYNPNYQQIESSDYVTPALLTVTFGGEPDLSIANAPIMRIANVGTTASPNDYVTGKLVATSEPGTLLLMGIGLIGIAIVMREML
jgi:hypothetical protein